MEVLAERVIFIVGGLVNVVNDRKKKVNIYFVVEPSLKVEMSKIAGHHLNVNRIKGYAECLAYEMALGATICFENIDPKVCIV